MTGLDRLAVPGKIDETSLSDDQHIAVSTVEELVSAARLAANTPTHSRRPWFRGERCSRFELRPSAFRQGLAGDVLVAAERRALERFRQRSLPYWPEGYPQNDWEHLFAMQHHGVPTRLLDWSENLFVALQFAFDGNCQHDGAAACNPRLWVLDPHALNRRVLNHVVSADELAPILTHYDVDNLDNYVPGSRKGWWKFPVAIYGAFNSSRMTAQRGTFSVWGSDPRVLDEQVRDPDSPVKPAHLVMIRLLGDRDQWRQDIDLLGFARSMIFPDLPGLAQEVAAAEFRSHPQ